MSEVIRVANLHKTYRMGDVDVPALRGVNLVVEHGEFVAIMGASGSGKSTFMNIVGCLDRPTSGRYLLEGQEVGSLSRDDWAHIRNKRIGFVFQGFNLLARTSAVENVELPLMYNGLATGRRRQRAIEVLSLVGLESRLHHLPNQLSGGQQQRVAIARALVNRPSLILADEPTGNLDPHTADHVFEALIHLIHSTGVAALIATHNMELARRMDRVLRLEDGILIEVGRSGAR